MKSLIPDTRGQTLFGMRDGVAQSCQVCPYRKFVFDLRQKIPAPFEPAHVGISLRDAIEQVLAAKRTAGLREKYIKGLGLYLNQFARGRENIPLAAIGIDEVEKWFTERNEKPVSRASNIGRLSALFSYHVRRDNIIVNPCDKLERMTIERKPPTVLSPDQVEKLLRIAPRHFKPYLILGLFVGIRPDEIMKLTWADVCLETKTVRVNSAKTRRRRIVPLEPRAVSLLDACPSKTGNIAPSYSTVRRLKRIARDALGFSTWPQDLLRHTAASYLLALHGDAGKVATRLGNSSSILLTHYHEPVKKTDCDRFWQTPAR